MPGKNVRPLAGHPLIAYSIAAARASSVFDAVVVSTDSEQIAEVARRYGAETPELRPVELATATSPDVRWIQRMVGVLEGAGRTFDAFSIVRPTSPFRGAATIRRAWEAFSAAEGADSLRAVELCRQHPGKQWRIQDGFMTPVLEAPAGELPYHSRQYQDLPPVYVQNSSLEIAWTRILADDEIAGRRVLPFLTEGAEGFSIDYPADWELAERMVASGEAELPRVEAEALT